MRLELPQRELSHQLVGLILVRRLTVAMASF
jgi:hypothetical protein